MDMNPYVIEMVAHHQLAELRAGAELQSQLRAAAAPRRPLRVTLGLALIRAGTWTIGRALQSPAPRTS
jgi:hypothetical protein